MAAYQYKQAKKQQNTTPGRREETVTEFELKDPGFDDNDYSEFLEEED